MQSPQSGINILFSFLNLAAVGVAIVLAGGLIPLVRGQLASRLPVVPLGNGSWRLVLWTIVSALLFLPLNDGLRILQTLPSIFMRSGWASESAAATGWGTAPWPLYLILYDLLLLAGYLAALLALRRRGAPASEYSDRRGWLLLTLGAAGLLVRFLQSIVVTVIFFPLALPGPDRGVAGFLLAWALALLLLLGTLAGMRYRLDVDHEDTAAA